MIFFKTFLRYSAVLWLPFFLFVATLFASVTPPNGLPSVQVKGRQLLVNGKPFVIKAVCYSPVRKGESYVGDAGFNPSSLLTVHPSKSDLAIIDADFKAMKEAGINTIRVYYPITDASVLAKLDAYNLKVIVPVFTTYENSSSIVATTLSVIRTLRYQKSTLFWEIGNEWNYNYFYSRSSASNEPLSCSSDYPNSSSNLTYDRYRCTDLSSCVAHLSRFINKVRELDSKHPISTCLGDIPYDIDGFWKLLPNDKIDIYGVNIYDGASFNAAYPPNIPRFERWKMITRPVSAGGIGEKPLYISEYGATAYNLAKNGVPLYSNYKDVVAMIDAIDSYFMPGPLQYVLPATVPCFPMPGIVDVWGVDESAQADGITALSNEVHDNLSANDPNNILLGGAVFEFNDELWKAPHADPSEHSIGGFGFADPHAGILCGGPYPDNYFHEEWFGLLTIDRCKRPSFDALKAVYTADDDNGLPLVSRDSHHH